MKRNNVTKKNDANPLKFNSFFLNKFEYKLHSQSMSEKHFNAQHQLGEDYKVLFETSSLTTINFRSFQQEEERRGMKLALKKPTYIAPYKYNRLEVSHSDHHRSSLSPPTQKLNTKVLPKQFKRFSD